MVNRVFQFFLCVWTFAAGATLEGAGGIGGLLARSQLNHPTAPHAFYHADGGGNITALINQNQQVVARYNYSPFGSIINQSGYLADANTYRFSSKEYHAPSGLSYYLHRFYDPSLQRWVNEDPIGEAGGINLYGFVRNRPVNAIDPFGHCETDPAAFFGNLSTLLDAAFGFADWVSDYTGATDALGMRPSDMAMALGPMGGQFGGPRGNFGRASASESKMVTVLGSRRDVAPFARKPGFNVLNMDNLPEIEWPRFNSSWLNEAIQRGDDIWLVTDPRKHQQLMNSLPGNPQSFYLNLELPMLNQYSCVNSVPVYANPAK